MTDVLKLAPRELPQSLTFARFAADKVATETDACDVLAVLLRSKLNNSEKEELTGMLTRVASVHGGPTDQQEQLISYNARRLKAQSYSRRVPGTRLRSVSSSLACQARYRNPRRSRQNQQTEQHADGEQKPSRDRRLTLFLLSVSQPHVQPHRNPARLWDRAEFYATKMSRSAPTAARQHGV